MHLSEMPSGWNTVAMGRRSLLQLASGALTAASVTTAALAWQFEAVFVDVHRIEVFAYEKFDGDIEPVIKQAQLMQMILTYVSNQLAAQKPRIDVVLAGDSRGNEAATLPNQVLRAILVIWMQRDLKDSSESPALLGAAGLILTKGRHSLQLHANHLELFQVPAEDALDPLQAIEDAVRRELNVGLIQPILRASK